MAAEEADAVWASCRARATAAAASAAASAMHSASARKPALLYTKKTPFFGEWPQFFRRAQMRYIDASTAPTVGCSSDLPKVLNAPKLPKLVPSATKVGG